MSIIGKSRWGSQSQFTKSNWFSLKAGDNIYRILPPWGEVAVQAGKPAYFYATHKGFRNSENRMVPFQCVEKKNWKVKPAVVEIQCPVCELVKKLEVSYQQAKDAGQPADKLKEFFETKVLPFKVDRKWYLNVVDLEGRIGILSLPSTAYNHLTAVAEAMSSKEGIEVDGAQGVYLNFKKIQKFKGDRDTDYAVEPYMETVKINGRDLKDYKRHDMTPPDFMERVKKEARLLNELFKRISDEEVMLIVSTPEAQRGALLDTIFAKPEKEDASVTSVLTMPGTDVGVATTIGFDNNKNLQVDSFDLGTAKKTAAPQSEPMTLGEDDFFAQFAQGKN
jgi:hypothetical protein